MNTNRFQPSIAFEVIILLFLTVQTYIVYRENSNVGSLRAFLNQPWIALELSTLLLFIVVFILDISLLLRVQQVPRGTYVLDPLKKDYAFCDLSVREEDWRSRARGAKAT